MYQEKLVHTGVLNLLEYKCDLSIKIMSRTCRSETCRSYLKLKKFKLRHIS